MMLYFAFIAQTDAVFWQLKQWVHDDVDLAYQAAGAVCNHVLTEVARGDKLASHYTGQAGDVTVETRVRRESNRIYVALLWVGIDGDGSGPPDGGEGLDHIAFGRLREIAQAGVTHIGRQVSFQQLGGRPIPNFNRTYIVDWLETHWPNSERRSVIPNPAMREDTITTRQRLNRCDSNRPFLAKLDYRGHLRKRYSSCAAISEPDYRTSRLSPLRFQLWFGGPARERSCNPSADRPAGCSAIPPRPIATLSFRPVPIHPIGNQFWRLPSHGAFAQGNQAESFDVILG